MTGADDKEKQGEKKSWLKRLGVIGFLFFLIKGLVWLGIAAYTWWRLKD